MRLLVPYCVRVCVVGVGENGVMTRTGTKNTNLTQGQIRQARLANGDLTEFLDWRRHVEPYTLLGRCFPVRFDDSHSALYVHKRGKDIVQFIGNHRCCALGIFLHSYIGPATQISDRQPLRAPPASCVSISLCRPFPFVSLRLLSISLC
jgi:hypothetical protein